MMLGRLVVLCLLLAACAWPGAAVRAEPTVRVVELFSFSCSHCARFHRDIYPWLKRDYIDTGKVSFSYRDFPLNLAALKAAQAARCGGDDRYPDLVDLLWRHWDGWIGEDDVVPPLVRLLAGAGIDEDAARSCLADGGELERRVLVAMRSAIESCAVDQTPTILINDVKIAGLPSKARLKAAIEEQLEAPADAERRSCLDGEG